MITNDDSDMPQPSVDTPAITTGQIREVDRLMVETYGIELLQMMENAGQHLAHIPRRRFLDGDSRDRNSPRSYHSGRGDPNAGSAQGWTRNA